MHDQSDAQLLRAYAERGAEAAFGDLLFRRLAACIAPLSLLTPADYQSATQQTDWLCYTASVDHRSTPG